jgi:hypothetical protein
MPLPPGKQYLTGKLIKDNSATSLAAKLATAKCFRLAAHVLSDLAEAATEKTDHRGYYERRV